MHLRKTGVMGNVEAYEHHPRLEGGWGKGGVMLSVPSHRGSVAKALLREELGECRFAPQHSQDLLCLQQITPRPHFLFYFLSDISVSRA